MPTYAGAACIRVAFRWQRGSHAHIRGRGVHAANSCIRGREQNRVRVKLLAALLQWGQPEEMR